MHIIVYDIEKRELLVDSNKYSLEIFLSKTRNGAHSKVDK